MRFFTIFLSLDHKFALIEYDDSWQQCGKSHEKMFGAQIWAKEAKIGPQNCFLPFSQVWFFSFSLNCIDDSLEQCVTTSGGKAREIKSGGWGAKLVFFGIFSSLNHMSNI